MEEIKEICSRPRRFNACKGINGFKDMTAELEKMRDEVARTSGPQPVNKEALEYMNSKVKAAFDKLLPWADKSLLWSCAMSWEWSKELSCHMMLEALPAPGGPLPAPGGACAQHQSLAREPRSTHLVARAAFRTTFCDSAGRQGSFPQFRKPPLAYLRGSPSSLHFAWRAPLWPVQTC